jgi:hypothetical protein
VQPLIHRQLADQGDGDLHPFGELFQRLAVRHLCELTEAVEML